jgi:hypothetical protein
MRCKVKCVSVTKRLDQSWDSLTQKSYERFVYDAKFYPVSGGSEENKRFFASTPSGNIELSTIREDEFVPGKEYYIDFLCA